MAIEAVQLLAPQGPLESGLFPGTDSNALLVRLQASLDAAYADERVKDVTPAAKKDRMARALALHTAYMAVYQRMLNEPNSVNLAEKGTTSYTDKQREGMKALADQYLAEFESLIDVPTTVAPIVRDTYVPMFVTW